MEYGVTASGVHAPAARAAQQMDERTHVGRFLELAGIAADVVAGDRPDFVLTVGGRRVGLEHRELVENDLARNAPNIDFLQQSLRNDLIRRGLGADIFVGLDVDAHSHVFRARRDVERMVALLSELAAVHARNAASEPRMIADARELQERGLLGCRMLRLGRHKVGRVGLQVAVSPGFWGPVGASVEDAIREKEAKVSGYSVEPPVEAYWLLLVTGASWRHATDSELTRWTRVPTKGFERVYLLDLRTDEVQRVDAH